MRLLDQHLEGAMVAALHPREPLQEIRRSFGKLLVSMDIVDATKERGEPSETAD